MHQRVKRFPTTANVMRKKARKKLVRDQRLLADQTEAAKCGITVDKLRWQRIAYWSGLLASLKAREIEALRQARLQLEQRRYVRYSIYD